MPADLASTLALYAAGQYQPATFAERGLLLPCTTPQLLGARLRRVGHGPVELILANPAGVEGVYVVPWSAVPDIASPTLHDRALWARVAAVTEPVPRGIRAAARAVAAEGYAGRAAARQAAAVIVEEREATTRVQYHLLLDLVRQGEGSSPAGPPPERDDPARVEARAQAVLRRLRGEGGLAPAEAIAALADLADACRGCGLRGDPTRAPLPGLAAEILAVVSEVAAWAGAGIDTDRAGARLLVRAAEVTLRVARAALDGAHRLLEPLAPLLRDWRNHPAPMRARIARPDWVLDGWETICALWREAPHSARAATLFDMAGLVPVLPREARGWAGFDADTELDHQLDGLRRWRRAQPAHQDWMRGRQLELISRNEALRARAA